MITSTERLYIILLGPPGAGKGTQAERLARSAGLAHVASGDLFRHYVARDTDLGRQAKTFMDRGLLVPDELTIWMVMDHLDRDSVGKGAILDGFPRTLKQAQAFEAALKDRGERIGCAIYLEVRTPELVRRLTSRLICRACQTPHTSVDGGSEIERCSRCGGELYQRDDDRPETVARRMDVFFTDTAPMIEYFRSQDKLFKVDGERAVEEVSQDLRTVVRTCLTTK